MLPLRKRQCGVFSCSLYMVGDRLTRVCVCVAVCRSCLVQYLETENCCPLCGQLVHKTKPLDYILPDKILQDLAYKLIPNLYTSKVYLVLYVRRFVFHCECVQFMH